MKAADVDTSGFQNIVLMLVGVLMIMLISNVLTIISNPDNIKIGALVTGTVYEEEGENGDPTTFIPPKFQNMEKNPVYIEVRRNRLIIYPEYTVVSESDLRLPEDAFTEFLKQLLPIADQRYIVLLLRPNSAPFYRTVKRIIQDYGIDVGFEPWEANRVIRVSGMVDLSGNLYEEDDAPGAHTGKIPGEDDASAEDAPDAENAFDQAAEALDAEAPTTPEGE